MLTEMDKLGFIHNDIKAENIMVKYDANHVPNCKLIDLDSGSFGSKRGSCWTT